MKVGTKIKELSTHKLTKHQLVRGPGVVTAVKCTDPLNNRGLVIVRTRCGNYLHLTNVEGITQ